MAQVLRYLGDVRLLSAGLRLQAHQRKMERACTRAPGSLVLARRAGLSAPMFRRVGCIPWLILGSGKRSKTNQTKTPKRHGNIPSMFLLSAGRKCLVWNTSQFYFYLLWSFWFWPPGIIRSSSSTEVSLSLIPFPLMHTPWTEYIHSSVNNEAQLISNYRRNLSCHDSGPVVIGSPCVLCWILSKCIKHKQ